MAKNPKLEILFKEITDKAANRIMPRVKLLNGKLRGPHNKVAMVENEIMIAEFMSQVYLLGLEDGYYIKESEMLTKK